MQAREQGSSPWPVHHLAPPTSSKSHQTARSLVPTHEYTPEEIQLIKDQAKLEGKVDAVCEQMLVMQKMLGEMPALIEAAVTRVAASIRAEFGPMRKAVLGNGSTKDAIVTKIAEHEQSLEDLHDAEVIRATERNSTNISLMLKIGIPVLLAILGGVIGNLFV